MVLQVAIIGRDRMENGCLNAYFAIKCFNNRDKVMVGKPMGFTVKASRAIIAAAKPDNKIAAIAT